MRRMMMIAASAFLFVFLAQGTPCFAQGGQPWGTYRDSCRNINYNGSRLSAQCQMENGGWRDTSIDYRNCGGGQVINDNGNLRCGTGSGRPGGDHVSGWRGGLPPGDYRRTCQNMRVEGNRLFATCQRTDGSWHDTSLNNVSQCRMPIANDNGSLTCPK